MAKIKNVVEPFGDVSVFPSPHGGTRVVATILMEPYREGAQTGIALDGSGSMRKLYGQSPGGGVVSSIFKKPTLQNEMSPVAQQICAYLARKIDADHGTTCIYWATGTGQAIEVIGDFTAEQVEKYEFKGPRDFGTGTYLLPAVQYFVERFKDAPWGFFVFITDGELFDLEEVKQFSTRLAQDIAAGRRHPVKFVLIGLGPDVNEKQMEALDDLDTGTFIDLWDHKLAAEMRVLPQIFAEVVDKNARVADNGRVLDPQGKVVKNYSDTGLPALLAFELPPGATYFTLEVDGQRIQQPITDQPGAIPSPPGQKVAPAVQATVPQPTPQPPYPTPPEPAPPMPGPPVPPQPIPPEPAPPTPAPPHVPPPSGEKKPGWEEEPRDLELEELAKSITLEFEHTSDKKEDDGGGVDLEKSE